MIVAGMRMETMARITNAEDRLWTVTGMRRGDVWKPTVIGTRNGMDGSSSCWDATGDAAGAER